MRNSHKNPGSTSKGKHWFTNGIVNTLAYDCQKVIGKVNTKKNYNDNYERRYNKKIRKQSDY